MKKAREPLKDDDKIKKLKKFSSDISKSLKEVSEFDTSFESNLELMRKLRMLMLDNLKVCDGAYKAKPTQGNSYALTNMIAQIKDLTDRIAESIDYDEVSYNLFEEVIKPFIEKLVLDLGSTISNELDMLDSKERKLVSRTINKIYKKYGSNLETKLPILSEKITKNIQKAVN